MAQAVEAYYDELRRFIHRRTGSPAIADEVVQETWIRANATDVAMPDNPRAYLYRMAGNLAIDHLRRVDRTNAWLEDDNDAAMERAESRTPPPDEVLASRQEWDLLTQAVEELPEKCRAVFLMYRGQGMTMRQIAASLGISDKTVEKHIARAMLHCRQRLRDAGRDV